MKNVRWACAVVLPLAALVTGVARAGIEILPIHQTGPLTEATLSGVANLVTAGLEAPLKFESRRIPPADFCKSLHDGTGALHVATLAIYRKCDTDLPALRALDFPFLARDWRAARRLLIGPIGAAITEAFGKRNLDLLGFWDGDIRVFSSSSAIAKASDLRGRKVFGPNTFASNSAIAQSGGTRIAMEFAEVYAAMQTGIADTADAQAGFFNNMRLYELHKNVLVSNHSLDPYILAIPSKTISNFTVPQRAFMDQAVRDATVIQIAEGVKYQAVTISRWREAGVNVAALSPDLASAFRTTTLLKASAQQGEGVFASSSKPIADAATRQVAGQDFLPYWKVFFVTNRARKGNRFTNDFSKDLLFGTANTRMEWDDAYTSRSELQKDGVNNLISYNWSREKVAVDWAKVSGRPFPDGFAKSPHAMPAKAPLIYVHGFANTFDDAAERAAWLGWNARRPAIMFAWASQGSPSKQNYKTDKQNAAKTWASLATVLERLGKEYDAETDLDIVVHSMGAFVLHGALEELQKRAAPGKPPKFRQIVLVAADIPSEKLNKTWGELGNFFVNKATLYVSNHDLALGISKNDMNPAEGDRAGLAPPVLIRDGIESIFIGPNDFSFIGHSYHITNGIIGDDILELLRYGTGASQRRGAGPARPPNKYFVLRRLRTP